MDKANVFAQYLSKVYKNREMPYKEGVGPVISITRNIGCFASPIAEKLVSKINNNLGNENKNRQWSWISKEILEKSAQELKTDPENIAPIFSAKEKSFFEDLATSFISKYYVSDSNIIATIKAVILSYAHVGNIVIVGRASQIISKEIKKSLHIKLIAPLEYRVKQIADKHHLEPKKAKKLVTDTDTQRTNFMKLFMGDTPELNFYDLIINRSKYSEDYIVDLIYKLAQDRNLF
jgi:cytidylate kinase